MAEVRLVISVTDEKASDLSSVAAELRNAGANVEQSYESLGTIIATADESCVDALARVPGVMNVEQERIVYPA